MLKNEEFVRGFSLYILPKRFVCIRHYDILSSSWKRGKLQLAISVRFVLGFWTKIPKKTLIEGGINVVLFKNKEDWIYGVTFVHHNSKGVFKGSQLSKNLSANDFHEKFTNNLDKE